MKQWISVNDILPQNDSDELTGDAYSIDCIAGNKESVYYNAYLEYNSKTWRDEDGSIIKVTHWMPLLKPPEVK